MPTGNGCFHGGGAIRCSFGTSAGKADGPASAAQPAAKPTSAPKPGPAPPADSKVTHWQCDNILLDLQEDGATARIDFSGRSLTLQHGESLVGARYADRQGNAFTRDGDKGNARPCQR